MSEAPLCKTKQPDVRSVRIQPTRLIVRNINTRQIKKLKTLNQRKKKSYNCTEFQKH